MFMIHNLSKIEQTSDPDISELKIWIPDKISFFPSLQKRPEGLKKGVP